MKKKKRTPAEEPVPGYCYVLEGYLRGWAPLAAPEKGMMLRTSQDIADDLEDMISIDASMVASVMSQLGFRAHYTIDGGPHGWMMRKDPAAIHNIRPTAPEDDPDDD